MSSIVEAQKATVHALVEYINTRNIDALLAQRTPDATHTVLPKSMSPDGKPEVRTNDVHKAWLENFLPLLGEFQIVRANKL